MPEPQDECCDFTIGNKWLPEVFRLVIGRECNYDDPKDRRLIHCVTYLLQLAGVPIGEYGYDLVKIGVLSLDLLRDLHYEFVERKDKPTLGKISPEYMQHIAKLKKCVDNAPCDVTDYLEAVCGCEWIHRCRYWTKTVQETTKRYMEDRKKYGIEADKKICLKAARDAKTLSFWKYY